MTYHTILAFIVGALLGNLFGMFLMAMLISADRSDNAAPH